MKPAPFGYRSAGSVAEAIEMLSELGGEARVLAGGQSLGPMLNLRMVRPSHLVDIGRIAQLRTVEQRAGGALRLGACVTHAQIEDGALAGETGRYLGFVARGIGYRAIRARGTVGGSLAHADPSADWPCALAAIGAQVEIAGRDGTRILPVAQLVRGLFETAIAPGEVLTAIEVPVARRFGWGYRKETRKTGEFAHALAACVYGGTAVAEVWLGALGQKPMCLPIDTGTAHYEQIDARLRSDFPLEDDYAHHLHALVAARAVTDALRMYAG